MTATLPLLNEGQIKTEIPRSAMVPGRPGTWGSIADAVRGSLLARRMPPMSYMELILSSDCNLRCAYCFEKDKQPLDMPDEVALCAVDFLIEVSGNLKGVGILLFGGEPMLRFDLIQKVHAYATEKAKAAGKSIDWSMTTNGTLVDAECAEWLARRGVRYLLSMDGGRQDHDRYRHFPDGRGTFDLLINRLPMMKRFQAWMGVKMSVVPQSLATLRDGIEELHRAGINQFLVGYAHGVPWSDDDVRRYESCATRGMRVVPGNGVPQTALPNRYVRGEESSGPAGRAGLRLWGGTRAVLCGSVRRPLRMLEAGHDPRIGEGRLANGQRLSGIHGRPEPDGPAGNGRWASARVRRVRVEARVRRRVPRGQRRRGARHLRLRRPFLQAFLCHPSG